MVMDSSYVSLEDEGGGTMVEPFVADLPVNGLLYPEGNDPMPIEVEKELNIQMEQGTSTMPRYLVLGGIFLIFVAILQIWSRETVIPLRDQGEVSLAIDYATNGTQANGVRA